MRKRKKTYITLGGLSLLLISLFFLVKSVLFAQNQPAVSLYVIDSITSTWDNYQEADLRPIGCRRSELPNGLLTAIQLRTPEEFLNLKNNIQNSPCNNRPLGAKAPMYYVLRVSKNNPRVIFYDAHNNKVLDFDIRNLGRDKGSYYEISGVLNPNAMIDRWQIDVQNTAGQSIDALQFYLASENLNDFPAAQQKFAGFLFYRDGNYTTNKEDIPSPSTLNFAFFHSPMFCGQNYSGLLRENTGKITIGPTPVPLNNQPTNFSKTLYAQKNTQAKLWLAESESKRQLTPTISLSILGGGGFDLGITELGVIVNVATSGYATCVNATTTLTAEVTNFSDEEYHGNDTITLSINGSSKQQNLGQINAYESKTYSMTWTPTATGTYTFTATLNLTDAFPNDNSASIDILVYSENNCPAAKNYYCVGGFCYLCPGKVVPPSASCQLRPNQECIQRGISCKPQVRE